jgi:hypothetical protein
MDIEVTSPDGSAATFPQGAPTSAMQAALAGVYGGPQTAGVALAQLSDPQTPASAQFQPDASLAPLPPGGGYGPIADAAQTAARPSLNALAADPTPVWNGKLALLSHARAVRDAAGEMAGSMLDAGVSPALAGLAADPDTGEWGLPKSLDDVTGSPPTAATWLGLYNTLPSLMETAPWTGAVLPDGDSPLNANIAKIAGHLSSAFVGDPDTGEGGAIPGYGQVLNQFGDHFSIRAAHDAMSGALFSSDPSFNAAWASAQTPAEQAAARTAIAGDINDRLQSGRILPGQLGSPDTQSRLATAFGTDGAQTIAGQAEDILAHRYASPAGDKAPSAPAVTAPPTPALAIGAQPLTPTTPIAASLVQGFDPGGIASSLRPAGGGHGDSGLRQGRSDPSAPLRGPLLAPPQGQLPGGDRYAEGGDGARPLLDANGNPEIVITGRRQTLINPVTPIPSQSGPGGFLGAVNGFGHALEQFAYPDSVGFYRRQYHSIPLTPAQLAPVRQEEAEQHAREHAYSLSPSGIGLGTPVAASALLLGAAAADAAPLLVGGAQALGSAALRFVNHPLAVAGAILATRLAHGALTGADPGIEPPVDVPDPADIERYVSGLFSKATPTSKAHNLFEIEQTGPLNYRVVSRNAQVYVDGYTGSAIDEAKFVGNAGSSPFVDGSRVPDLVKALVLQKQQRQFQRLGAIIADPDVPFNKINVLTNHPAAVPYFRNLMDLYSIPGSVTVVPTAIPFK